MSKLKALFYGFITVAGLVAVSIVLFTFFYKPCIEPNISQKVIVQLKCAAELFSTPDEVLYHDMCIFLKKDENCSLDLENTDDIDVYYNYIELKCIKKMYVEHNYCSNDIRLIGRNR